MSPITKDTGKAPALAVSKSIFPAKHPAAEKPSEPPASIIDKNQFTLVTQKKLSEYPLTNLASSRASKAVLTNASNRVIGGRGGGRGIGGCGRGRGGGKPVKTTNRNQYEVLKESDIKDEDMITMDKDSKSIYQDKENNPTIVDPDATDAVTQLTNNRPLPEKHNMMTIEKTDNTNDSIPDTNMNPSPEKETAAETMPKAIEYATNSNSINVRVDPSKNQNHGKRFEKTRFLGSVLQAILHKISYLQAGDHQIRQSDRDWFFTTPEVLKTFTYHSLTAWIRSAKAIIQVNARPASTTICQSAIDDDMG
jgi:hypothetical protein